MSERKRKSSGASKDTPSKGSSSAFVRGATCAWHMCVCTGKRIAYHMGRAFRRLLFYILGAALSGLCVLAALVFYFSRDLPPIDSLFLAYRRPCIRLFAANGSLLATYGDAYGDVVPLRALPDYVPKALVAVEDRRFFQHFGIDLWGIGRALWTNYQSGRVVQGGSTLTQQLAKSLLQAHQLYGIYDRSIRRKVQEVILSLVLEMKLSKAQILTLYLNRVYFGAGAFGIDAASIRYFGKPSTQLSLYEAALLMGLLKAPSRYSPAQSTKRAENRTKQVLQTMVNAGYLTPGGMEATLTLASGSPEITNASSVHYFTDWVIDHLRQIVSLNQDLDVITTLDLQQQELATQQLTRVMNKRARRWGADQMALVCMTPEGSIKAMVGGVNYAESKFNRVTQASRQAGSLFKFFTFLEAFEQGWTPEDRMDDTPMEIGGWAPRNYLYEAQGDVSLKEAFSRSINAVAVRLAHQVGVKALAKAARRLGITTPIPHNLSISLGSSSITLLEVTGAFATLANQGVRVKPHGILTIKNRHGHVLYTWTPPTQTVISPRALADMLYVMQAAVNGGTARRARMKTQPTGCKTGTSQLDRDLWFVGFSPQLVTGVWTGRDSDKPLTYQAGGSPSGHLWQAFMQKALQPYPPGVFRVPSYKEETSSLRDGFTSGGRMGIVRVQKPSAAALPSQAQATPSPRKDLASTKDGVSRPYTLDDFLSRLSAESGT